MDKFLTILAASGNPQIDPLPSGYQGGDIKTTVGNIIQTVIGILGIVCVVIIIIGGIQYMTSSGDASKVKKAKDTILYGVIGMIICVLAFAITTFVINAING